MGKSGSGKKRKAAMKHGATKPRRDVREHADKMRDNAGLLLRAVAYLVQHSPQIAMHFREKGDARIPIGALASDVAVSIVVEDGHLVIVPAPLPPAEEAPLTIEVVVDLLGLVSKHATAEDVEPWTEAQREAAADWAGREHSYASDNLDVERLPQPEHVKALPDVLGIDPPSPYVPGGFWTTRLRHADGRESMFIQVPGDPTTRREVPAEVPA